MNSTQLSALSRLFSSTVLREMATKARSPLFSRLFGQSSLSHEQFAHQTVGSVFDAAFAALRRSGLRNEYVYRAALTHNILLGRHSLKTASMLTEFRVGSCKADLVILNGTGTIYEIKSDRDSLARLPNQLENYRKVFASVYVIAGALHVNEVLDLAPSDVGVLSLVRWDRIKTIREAVVRPELVCPLAIFESLRTNEARAVLKTVKVAVSDVPNTLIRQEMRGHFAKLDPTLAHQKMVETLKRTRNLAPLGSLVELLPTSLQPAALFVQMGRAERERFVAATRTPLTVAMNWA